MKPDLVIILAAGEGRRLRPFTLSLPKCLVPVGGSSFLQRSLNALARFSFQEICVVTGYLSKEVSRFVASCSSGADIRLCHNEHFERTNNAASLRMALRENPGRSFLLLDGDLLFDERILGGVLEDPRENLLVVETNREGLNEEAMKVLTSSQGVLTKIGKDLPLKEAAGEYIGMARFSENWAGILIEESESRIRDPAFQNFYYEDMINLLLPAAPPLGLFPVNGLSWAEVDTPEDLKKVSFAGTRGRPPESRRDSRVPQSPRRRSASHPDKGG